MNGHVRESTRGDGEDDPGAAEVCHVNRVGFEPISLLGCVGLLRSPTLKTVRRVGHRQQVGDQMSLTTKTVMVRLAILSVVLSVIKMS